MGKKKVLSPEEAREQRRIKAEKKRAARKRKTSAAAVMGAMFSFIFVGSVLLLLFKISVAIKERDKIPAGEVYRAPAVAVTDVSSSSGADTASQPAETTVPEAVTPAPVTTTETADPLVVVPGESTSGEGSVTKKKLRQAAHSIYDLSPLKQEITDKISSFEGDWQVYVRHMASGKEIYIDSKPVYAASLIKLYAAGAAYQQVSEGKQDSAYIDELVRPMITESKNESFDTLVEVIGQQYMTEWCRQQGYWDTVVTHEISSEEVYENNRVSDKDNTTSALDTGRFLSSLYRGEIVNRDYSDRIVNLMKAQVKRSKIPAGIGESATSANKTGETDDVDHDAAIIYCDTGDYVLVVMGDTKGFGWTADDYIVQVSDLVYKYFNGDPNASSSTADEDDEEGEGEGEGEESESTDESSEE